MTPSDSADPVFDARLADLRSRFKAALGPKIERVAKSIAQLNPGEVSLAETEDLLTEVHSMAGAAAMFGMAEVHRAAAAIERKVLAIRSQTRATSDDVGSLSEACRYLEEVARTSS